MIIKYYNDVDLIYSNRLRFNSISFNNFIPFSQEEQRSVLFGDNAETTIKTNINNICNYVTIENTRWYVTSYVYLNGSQVQLYLTRDVIGEFGINSFFGKVERSSKLIFPVGYRKELNLNEILFSRKKIIGNSNNVQYSYTNAENELWGIMYFVKPTGIDPSTGEPYPDQVNVNIPAFNPVYIESTEIPLIADGSKFDNTEYNDNYKFEISFYFSFKPLLINYIYRFRFLYYKNYETNEIETQVVNDGIIINPTKTPLRVIFKHMYEGQLINSLIPDFASLVIILNMLWQGLINNNTDIFTIPNWNSYPKENIDYTNLNLKNGNSIYNYKSQLKQESLAQQTNISHFVDFLYALFNNQNGLYFDGSYLFMYDYENLQNNITNAFSVNSYHLNIYYKEYKRKLLTPSEAGQITISSQSNIIDEPYNILIIPLFDTVINNVGTINREDAFLTFNTIIQYLSGENGYLIDAQVYPYAPIFNSIAQELNNIPLFNLMSNSYVITEEIDFANELSKNSINVNVANIYNTKTFSIISPDKTGKYNFNYLDYKSNLNIPYLNKLSFTIKTALKPFNIFSMCVIQPELNSLIGITYYSDNRGCLPTSNGFQCSISSNQFQTYVRNNSMYQQNFNLEKEELRLNHETEKTNEIVSGIVSGLNAAALGGLSGYYISGGAINPGAGIGAAAGAIAGAATSATAYSIQGVQNEKLRDYEKYLQNEKFNLQIATIKNLPNVISRISSFNEIILNDFKYIVESYSASELECNIAEKYFSKYGFMLGYYANYSEVHINGGFLRGNLLSSSLQPNLHLLAIKDLQGGIYLYD